MPCCLARPVTYNSGRTDYEEVRLTPRTEVSENSKCFNGLTQPHLVTDDHLFLHEGKT